MKKIKNYIIHLLGGYTREEAEEIRSTYFEKGAINVASAIKIYLETLNGTPADEWCKLVYNYVCKIFKK